MKYKAVVEKDGVRLRWKYKQQLSELNDIKKGKVREKINSEVFDIEDSIADNAKMLFLLASLLLRIYNALPNDIKNNLSDTDRQIIEYALNKYKAANTRMDIQFQKEGVALIDKMLDRQKKVAEIIEEVYNE